MQILPTTGESNVLYLVPKSTSQTSNYYDEYVYANNNWEKIGDTEIDLSNYVTTTALNTALLNYTTTANLTTLLNAKQDTLIAGTNISIGADGKTISATDTTYEEATTSTAGLMSASDKIKTNAIVTTGDGSSYLANDGTYKSVSADGLPVFYINASDYIYSTPFVFSQHPIGIYIIKDAKTSTNNYPTQTFYAKAQSSNGSKYIPLQSGANIIYYTVKIEENETYNNVAFAYTSSYQASDGVRYRHVFVLNGGTFSDYASVYDDQYACVTTTQAQTISAKKTFSVLPESSITPTTDYQLVNKKSFLSKISYPLITCLA